MNNSIPESLLSKLYDATGSANGGNKGFIITYVNDAGDTTIVTRSENNCVMLALRKTLEIFVESDENVTIRQ